MKRKLNHNRQAVIVIMTVLISLGLAYFAGLIITSVPDPHYTKQYTDLSEAFYTFDSFDRTASNSRIFHNVDPDDYMNLGNHETYTIYTTIPESAPGDIAPCLFFKGQSCGVQVYIDQDNSNYNNSETELIFEANMDRYENHTMIPRSVHFVALPVDAPGKQLTIIFHSGKDNTGIVTKDFMYGSAEVLTRVYAQSKRYVVLVGEFMIALGVILILLPIIMRRRQDIIRNLFQGLLLLDLGIYVSCYNDIFVYILPDDLISITIEYYSLVAIPLLIHATLIAGENQKQFLFNKLFLGLDVLALIIISGLHFSKVLPLNEAGMIIHLYIGLSGLYTVFRIIYVDIIKRKRIGAELYGNIADRIINVGLLVMILLFYAELILYKLGVSSLHVGATDIRGGFLMLGGFIFIGCILLSFFFHTVATLRKDAVSKKLRGLAYTDELTGLSNRAFCDRMLEQYQVEEQDAIVISLDLDGLKVINDTLGHHAGDQYIQGFAGFMTEVFQDAQLVGRMGGDEFIILLRSLDVLRCESLLDQMRHKVDTYNEHQMNEILHGTSEPETNKTSDADPAVPISYAYEYSYSYGYATTKETSGSGYHIRQTYMLADQRMYRMKEEHHKNMHTIRGGGQP